MSMARDWHCFKVILAMPAAVELSVFNGVAGWIWPRVVNVVHRTVASWPLINKAPTSASAADAMTLHSMVHTVCTAPLLGGGVAGGLAGLLDLALR